MPGKKHLQGLQNNGHAEVRLPLAGCFFQRRDLPAMEMFGHEKKSKNLVFSHVKMG